MAGLLWTTAALLAVIGSAAGLLWLASWWEERTEEAVERVGESEVLDPVDPLTDELWMLARELERPAIFDELAYVKALDWKPELEMAA